MADLKEKTVLELRKLASKHKVPQSKAGKTKTKSQLVSALKAKKITGTTKKKTTTKRKTTKTVHKKSPTKKK